MTYGEREALWAACVNAMARAQLAVDEAARVHEESMRAVRLAVADVAILARRFRFEQAATQNQEDKE